VQTRLISELVTLMRGEKVKKCECGPQETLLFLKPSQGALGLPSVGVSAQLPSHSLVATTLHHCSFAWTNFSHKWTYFDAIKKKGRKKILVLY